MHFSFDYAQQLHYPSNPQQPGPIYFLTPWKCQLFGIACEPWGFQTNYLIDEAESIGKGANATISLVHHFLETHATKFDEVLLHADNCIGQNKNNAVVQYLLWRTMTGRQKKITLSFMLAGHTKFTPDRFFGLIKRTYRRTIVDTIGCLSHVVANSTTTGCNKVHLVRLPAGEVNVQFHDWTRYLT